MTEQEYRRRVSQLAGEIMAEIGCDPPESESVELWKRLRELTNGLCLCFLHRGMGDKPKDA